MTGEAPISRQAALAGIGFMLAGVFLFSFNDAIGKWLVSTYSVGQLMLIRSGTTMILLLPLIWRAGRAAFAGAPRPGLQILRIVLSTAEVSMFFWAVAYLPLADAITFYLAGPIYVTAFSALLLKEKVGWRRWTAVLVGFAGVVIALRPSATMFTLPALIALTGSVFFALLMVVTRMLRDTNDVVLMSGQFFGSFAFGAVTAPFVWITPSAYDFFFLSAFGAVSIVALFCINRSLKLAPASVVVPYQYTMLIWAIALGYLVFGDVPDAPMLLGGAIIVASGLYIFWREQITARDASFTPAPREAP
jgi:drug/metabolite transporter (DMT)-like permease